jgi:hypothetical protein
MTKPHSKSIYIFYKKDDEINGLALEYDMRWMERVTYFNRYFKLAQILRATNTCFLDDASFCKARYSSCRTVLHAPGFGIASIVDHHNHFASYTRSTKLTPSFNLTLSAQ